MLIQANRYRHTIKSGAVAKWRFAGVLSLILLVAVGCRSTAQITAPSAQVLGVKLVQQTQYGARLDIVVGLANPNFISLPLVESDYAITIEGVGSYRFSDRPHRTLPAGLESGGSPVGLQELRLPVAIDFDGGDLTGTAFKVHGAVFYEPPGEIRKLLTESNVALPKIEFLGAGQIQ